MDLVLDYCELKTGKGVFSAIPDFSTGEACISGEWGELHIRHTDGLIEPVLKPVAGLRIESISLRGLLRTEVHPDKLVFLKEGFQSWSYSGALGRNDAQKKPLAKFVIANQENTSNPPTNSKGHHVSDMFFFAGDRDSGQGLLVGQLAPFDQYLECSFAYGDYAHKVNLRWDMQYTPDGEREIALDRILLAKGEVNNLVAAYAERIAKDKKVSFHQKLRVGWCSWYYYYTNISADCILQNLDYSKKHSIAFDFFQIDDGYQSTIGDWLILRDSFKDRMPEITGRIKEAGYTPGLWLAPFIISKKSVHFNKPGWVLRNEKGKPVVAGLNPAWGGYYYALDITHPEVQEYVRRVFRTMIDEWGFTYLKLDFMYAASMPGVRHDQTLSRAQVMKLGNALIRETVGPDVTLLGCGMPIAPAIGYVDAMRVSCDVAPYWTPVFRDRIFRSDSMIETRGALRNSLVRSFMDKRFWINDPDCLMLRTRDTKLTAAERRTLYNAIMLVGGMLVTSDDMALYGEEELDNLSRAIGIFKQTHEGKVTALDLVQEKVPEIIWNDKGYLLLANFDESARSVHIDGGLASLLPVPAKGLRDMHTGEEYLFEAAAAVGLEAHDSLLCEIMR